MGSRERDAARDTARRIFDDMEPSTRAAFLDELVWGSFDWRDFFDDKPSPGVVSALGDLIESWEAVGAC